MEKEGGGNNEKGSVKAKDSKKNHRGYLKDGGIGKEKK